MAYSYQLRHRNLHKMHKHIENIVVARNPQKDEEEDPEDRPSSTGNRNNNNPKTVDSNTNAESTEFSSYVSVIFVTASPTFTDSVAGYTTLTDAPPDPTPEESVTYAVTEPSVEPSATEYLWTPASSSDAPVQTPTQVPASTNREPATSYVPPISTDAGMVAESPSESPSSSLPTAIAMASSSTLVTAYSSYTRIASRSLSTLTPSATSEAIASTEGNKGMSSGGKAGLAIGIILIIALAAGGGLWYYWKKKKAASGWRKADDEKVGGFGGSMAAMAAKNQGMKEKSSAPRLSLGPQFTPAVVAGKKSQGNPVGTMNNPAGMAAAGAGRNLTRDNPNGSPWERRAGGENNAANPFKDPVNPFGDQATAPAPPSVMVTPPMSESSSSTNAGAGAAGTAVGAAVAGGAAAAAGAAMVAGAAKNGNGQPKNGPGSPPGARMAAGAPPPSNVHRVQLDFRPSMEDELELRAGQLVRILHEYDDGWALCIRLDRSQKGVAPRTCLSARPVKPRPANGPPRGPPRGPPPMGSNGRPMSPAPLRPRSPAGSPGPRPQTPASAQGPSRPGTPHSNRAMSPPSPSQHSVKSQKSTHTAPGQFNQAPRPLSPGPIARPPNSPQSQRSQSPGPYGARSGPTPMIANQQRRRSNSASAVQARRNSPPGPSPLARGDDMPGWRPAKPQPQEDDSKSTPGVAL